ncbi:SDR family oxidoreductase [Arthrobacter sp. U41]|uniref:SDR family oxidoreductase n=1 Tax=Arthrobacter sp. U41 TaxID=1849032 RepID=UPI0008593379|nr:SDR family oxidoreductase [Arthrobacter sp. U41]AOT02585.1 3-oxoacyl-ACP reductase [Arthrobacter sp. U41]
MELGLKGKVAFVVGSTSGLGLGIAEALSHEGASVAVTGRRGDLARALAANMPSAVGVELDLTNVASRMAAIDQVVSTLGPIDVLVLNSGGPPAGQAALLHRDQMMSTIDTLLMAQIDLVQAALPTMRAQGWGRILGIGSRGVEQPIPNLAQSNIARSALAAYLKTLAGEVAQDGVTVNMILPGRIASERALSLDAGQAKREGTTAEDVRERSQNSIPAGRYGTAEEFGSVAAFLSSVKASYVTGAQIRVDGGLISSM